METMITRLMTQVDVYTLLALASSSPTEAARYERLAQEMLDRAIDLSDQEEAA